MDDDFLRDLEELGGEEEEEEAEEQEGRSLAGAGAAGEGSDAEEDSAAQGTSRQDWEEAEEDVEEGDDDADEEGEGQGTRVPGSRGPSTHLGKRPQSRDRGSSGDPAVLSLKAQLESKFRAAKDVHAIAKLTASRLYRETMEAIAHYSSTPRNPARDTGAVEEDPEYQVMVNANNLAIDIDQEITMVHKVGWRTRSWCPFFVSYSLMLAPLLIPDSPLTRPPPPVHL